MSSWKDRTYSRPDAASPAYPWIQWVNNGGSLEPRSDTGGFALPVEQMEVLGASIPGQMRTLRHRGGDQTQVVFATTLEAAVLETRFTWIKDDQALPEYEEGARGKLQALALVRDKDGSPAGPVILTFTGLASRDFSEALRAHGEAVRQTTGGQAPSYVFFGRYQAGETQMRGSSQKSRVTPVAYAGVNGFDPDAAFVGAEAADAIEATWEQVDRWKAAWDRNESAGQGQPQAERAGKPGPKEPQGRASDTQWQLIRRLMAEIGIEDQERQNQAMAQKGYDPAALKMDQASELIGRLLAARATSGSST